MYMRETEQRDRKYPVTEVKADSWFSHIAVEVPGEETSNEWLDPVDEETYSKLQ